jgi:hypothetical protein
LGYARCFGEPLRGEEVQRWRSLIRRA